MSNTIELAKSFVPKLDECYRLASLTSVLDGAPELAKQGANAIFSMGFRHGLMSTVLDRFRRKIRIRPDFSDFRQREIRLTLRIFDSKFKKQMKG